MGPYVAMYWPICGTSDDSSVEGMAPVIITRIQKKISTQILKPIITCNLKLFITQIMEPGGRFYYTSWLALLYCNVR